MKNIRSVIAGVALVAAASTSNAALINFNGAIDYHNDVVYTYFTLDQDATNVRVWTDSYLDGQNFDPITALWKADGTRLAENDDNASIDPSQTSWDSGFSLANLGAGDYIFTVATYDNFAISMDLGDGFAFDAQSRIALADWDQPASRKGMGPNWSVWLDGVDSASNPGDDPVVSVPEPGSLALIGLGMLGLGLSRRRKQASA